MNLKNYNLNKKDMPYLVLLTIFSIILIAYYINFTLNLGIFCPDVYIYLANALTFSGTNVNSPATMYLAPVICFLTSLLFRVGIQGEIAIFIVTGAFAILGIIGFYILLRTRFSNYLSFTGAIIYSCLSLNILWLANGMLDIPAVAVTIWIVIFTLIAINKDPRYYPIAFLAFLIGFLVRYTVGFILPVLVVYFIYKTRFKLDKRALKYLIGSIAACIAIFLIALYTLYSLHPNNLYFLEIINNALHGSKGAEYDVAYTLDTWFYLKQFLQYISSGYCAFSSNTPILQNPTPLAYGVIGLLIVGAGLSVNKLKQIKIKNKKLLIPILLLAIFIIATFTQIIGLISIGLTLILILLTYYVLKDSEFNQLELNLLFLTWFLVYFMYFTYFNTKVDRYFITVMPAFVYFVIASVEVIEDKINIKKVIPLILIVLFIINAFAFSFTIGEHKDFNEYKEITDILKEIDPNLSNKTVGAHFQRACLWYLKQPVVSLVGYNATKVDNSNVTYYIAPMTLNLTNYTLLVENKGMFLYINNRELG